MCHTYSKRISFHKIANFNKTILHILKKKSFYIIITKRKKKKKKKATTIYASDWKSNSLMTQNIVRTSERTEEIAQELKFLLQIPSQSKTLIQKKKIPPYSKKRTTIPVHSNYFTSEYRACTLKNLHE